MNYHDFILENTFYFDEASNNNNNTTLDDKKKIEEYKEKLRKQREEEKEKKEREKEEKKEQEKKEELKKYNKNMAKGAPIAAVGGLAAGYGIYRLLKHRNDKDVEKELNESYIDGYYDALLEMNEDYNVLNEVHLSRYAKHYRKASRKLDEKVADATMREIKKEYKKGNISQKEYENSIKKRNRFTMNNAVKCYDGSIEGMSKKDVRDATKNLKREYAKLPYKAAGVAAGGVAVASSLNAYNHNLYRAWINKNPKKRKDVTFKEWKKMGKPKN
jgi:hypothetical protein